jgi:Zn-dependent protease with chaperone function
MLSDEELDSVIAHECGHILCRHVLYHTLAQWLSKGLSFNGLLDKLTVPAQFALMYWQRKSELSADRVAAMVTSPQTVAHVMARLSGGPQELTQNVNLEEWAAQADKYNEIKNDGLWNKTLQMTITAFQSHPFAAVRVREILNWSLSDQYKALVQREEAMAQEICPNCKKHIESTWKFCKHCGYHLI